MPLRTNRLDDEGREGPDSDKRFHGKYLAFVRDSNDPEQRGRVRVYCPEVMGEVDAPEFWLGWAEANHFMTGFDQGFMAVPPDPTWNSRDQGGQSSPYNQTRVWIQFRDGDQARAVYSSSGSWYGENQLPHSGLKIADSNSGGDETTAKPNHISSTIRQVPSREDGTLSPGTAEEPPEDAVVTEQRPQTTAQYPFNHAYKSPAGHVVEFDNTAGAERFRLYHPAGSSLEINEAGTWATKVQGKESHFVVEDSTHVVQGGLTTIVEGTQHRQINRSSVEIFLDSRMVVMEKSVECYYKSGWDVNVGGRMGIVAGDFDLEAVGSIGLVTGGAVGVAGDDVSIGANTFEAAGTVLDLKCAAGVRLSIGESVLAVNPIYGSLAINQTLSNLIAPLQTATTTLVNASIPPGGNPILAPVATWAQAVTAFYIAAVQAFQGNLSNHKVSVP